MDEVWLDLQENPPPNLWEIGAQICCVIYNTAMGCRKPRKIPDFMPQKQKVKPK